MNARGYRKACSAGGVVVNGRGEVVVVKQEDNSWSLPKGHLIGDESTVAAAIREISEETGLGDLTLVRELGRYERPAEGGDGTPELKTIVVFLFTTTELELHPRDPANPEALWIRPESVASKLSNPVDKDFFNRVSDQL